MQAGSNVWSRLGMGKKVIWLAFPSGNGHFWSPKLANRLPLVPLASYVCLFIACDAFCCGKCAQYLLQIERNVLRQGRHTFEEWTWVDANTNTKMHIVWGKIHMQMYTDVCASRKINLINPYGTKNIIGFRQLAKNEIVRYELVPTETSNWGFCYCYLKCHNLEIICIPTLQFLRHGNMQRYFIRSWTIGLSCHIESTKLDPPAFQTESPMVYP